MTDTTRITIAYGDGIGPEIMTATMKVLEAAGARLETDVIEIGEKLYLHGVPSGIADDSWETLRRNKIFFKAPITTPQGGGVKSLNVTVRKTLGLYANVRPCSSYSPFVATNHPNMDVVIIRENEEGLYGGIEHQQTPEVIQCLRLMSIPGMRRIARYAFEYAKQNNRKKITCFTKDNIMKQTDGAFHRIFNEIGTEYPEIEQHHMIIDIATARLANRPDDFDVILAPNLYGDIISDVAAEITGSVGLAGSANIGSVCSMFEAIHGSAPDIAGQGIANPSGLIMGAVMMLTHIGQCDIATKIHNAWLTTIEEGIHTADIYRNDTSKQKVGTAEFAKAVIERLGQAPKQFPARNYVCEKPLNLSDKNIRVHEDTRELIGVDVFVYWDKDRDPNKLAEKIKPASNGTLQLKVISNRGTKVWPQAFPETFCTDHWCCRFLSANNTANNDDIITLLGQLHQQGIEFVKTENLYKINGEKAYARDQGE